MPLTIYHNPRCSKSRQTLERIEAAGQSPDVVRYLETPPDADTLTGLVQRLGRPVTDLVRFKEALAKELGLAADDARSQTQWIALLVEHPRLLERPIVDDGERAVIGRPPENVDALL